MKDETGTVGFTRRDVIKVASLASLASAFPGGVFAAGVSEKIRVGVIGCGGRGTDAALNCAEAVARRRHRRPRRRVPRPAPVVAGAAEAEAHPALG